MPATTRRPCVIDTAIHFCPHEGCDYRGWLGLGNLRANGHPSGGPWRQFYCRSCQGDFLETHGTIFHGKRLPGEFIVHVLACLAEGLGIRATARVFAVDPNTVLQWLVEAAEQLQAFTNSCLCDVHVTQLQLDAWYAVLRGRKDGQIREEQALKSLEPGRPWVWTAIDPVSQLLLAIEVGPRTVEMAQRVVGVKHRVVFGTLGAVEQVLAACGWKINTAMVERLNLDIRQRVAAIGRRVNTLCQGEPGLQHQLASTPVNEVQQTGLKGS